MKKPNTLTKWFRRSGAIRWARRHSFTEPRFQPYAKAIGQLLLAWNDFHERLSTLFVAAMGGGWVDRPLAIWHGARSDYSKREMLRKAISKLPDSEKAGRDKLVDEVTWILDQANKLEGLRDDSAHTPLHSPMPPIGILFPLSKDDPGSALFPPVFPDTAFQNPRAVRVDRETQDILAGYRFARERITVLRDYVIAIDYAWTNSRLLWPDRPWLPERHRRKTKRQIRGGRDRR